MNADAATISIPELGAIIQCMPFLASYDREDQLKWMNKLLASSQDAMTMTILSLLPNLRSLTLDRDVDKWYHNGMETLFRPLNSRRKLTTSLIADSTRPPRNAFPLFKDVSYLCIDGNLTGTEDAEWEVDTTAVYLRLPALRTFVGRGCADTLSHVVEGEQRLKDIGPFSNVTDITLEDCAIHTEDIQNVLRFCHALESLRCPRFCQKHFGVDPPPNYLYAGLYNDLYRHRGSLRSLQLHARACSHGITRHREPIETLAFLEKLEFLEVDEDVLFGNQGFTSRPLGRILPPNLQIVVVKGESHTYHQFSLFQEIGRALLSGEVRATFAVHDGCVTDAENVLRDMPTIEIREISEQYEVDTHWICSFIIYKEEDKAFKA